MSITAAAIAAGAALHSARKANKANKAEAEKNRQFQGGMSGTSYQRAVGDMKAAGINPMLSSRSAGPRPLPALFRPFRRKRLLR